jgi:hypothetical protein
MSLAMSEVLSRVGYLEGLEPMDSREKWMEWGLWFWK